MVGLWPSCSMSIGWTSTFLLDVHWLGVGLSPRCPLVARWPFSSMSTGRTLAFLLDVHWLGVGIPPRCPLAGRWHSSSKSTGWVVPLRGEIEHLFAPLAQDGLAECNQWGKNRLKYSTTAESTERTASEIHLFSHRAIRTQAMERTTRETHSFSH